MMIVREKDVVKPKMTLSTTRTELKVPLGSSADDVAALIEFTKLGRSVYDSRDEQLTARGRIHRRCSGTYYCFLYVNRGHKMSRRSVFNIHMERPFPGCDNVRR